MLLRYLINQWCNRRCRNCIELHSLAIYIIFLLVWKLKSYPQHENNNTRACTYLTLHVLTTQIHHGLTAQLIVAPRQEIDIFKMHIAVNGRLLFAVMCPDPYHLLCRPSVDHSRMCAAPVRKRHVLEDWVRLLFDFD